VVDRERRALLGALVAERIAAADVDDVRAGGQRGQLGTGDAVPLGLRVDVAFVGSADLRLKDERRTGTDGTGRRADGRRGSGRVDGPPIGRRRAVYVHRVVDGSNVERVRIAVVTEAGVHLRAAAGREGAFEWLQLALEGPRACRGERERHRRARG